MQVKSAAVDAFIARPDPSARALLLYGPDQGLVRERADALTAFVASDLKDPFRIAELPGAALRSGSAPLRDEAAALAFGGGRRVVRVRDAGDAHAAAFKDFLADPAGEALVVVEAGDLPKRSSLRLVFEAAKNAAALPCYRDEGRGLEQVIRAQLAEAGLRIETDALAWVAGTLVLAGISALPAIGVATRVELGYALGSLAVVGLLVVPLRRRARDPVPALRTGGPR